MNEIVDTDYTDYLDKNYEKEFKNMNSLPSRDLLVQGQQQKLQSNE